MKCVDRRTCRRHRLSQSSKADHHPQFRLIEWMMVLPTTLDRSFREELRRVQEENKMPYITGFERDGMVKATCESVIEVLETRFEAIPAELSSRLQEIEELAVLKRLHKQSITIASIEEFTRILDEVRRPQASPQEEQ